MAAQVWRVLAESDRLPWSFAPLERVGPLTFGMTHDQAQGAVDGILCVAGSQFERGGAGWVDLQYEAGTTPGLLGPAVTLYYDEAIGLAAVAVNALRGPQVTPQWMAAGGADALTRGG